MAVSAAPIRWTPGRRDARGGMGSATLPSGIMASMQDVQSLVGYTDLRESQ